jgi:hypothetical protein
METVARENDARRCTGKARHVGSGRHPAAMPFQRCRALAGNRERGRKTVTSWGTHRVGGSTRLPMTTEKCSEPGPRITFHVGNLLSPRLLAPKTPLAEKPQRFKATARKNNRSRRFPSTKARTLLSVVGVLLVFSSHPPKSPKDLR